MIAIAFLGTGVALDQLLGGQNFPVEFRAGGAAIFIGFGVRLLVSAMRRFRAAGTNVPTNVATTALVVDGPYDLSRNPIYIALIATYVGLAIALSSPSALTLVVGFVLTLRFGVILAEEKYLSAKFGETYRRYREATSRWF